MQEGEQQDTVSVVPEEAAPPLGESEGERLHAELAAWAEPAIGGLEGEVTYLRRELLAHQETLNAQQGELEKRGQEVLALQEQLREAVGRFREALLAAQPELPEEMVAGETIEEVEASVAMARQTVEQVRSHLAQHLRLESVPAGAPARGPMDLAALSPKEKIARGLAQRASG